MKVWDTKCSKHPCDTKRNANFLHFNFYCRLADYISSSMKKNGITVYQCESTPWGTYIHLMMQSNNICSLRENADIGKTIKLHTMPWMQGYKYQSLKTNSVELLLVHNQWTNWIHLLVIYLKQCVTVLQSTVNHINNNSILGWISYIYFNNTND